MGRHFVLGRSCGGFAVLLLCSGLLISCGDTDKGDSSDDPAVDGDASTGGGAGCDTDAECDDGLYCNGIEACVDGSCAPGDFVACDDGIACTVDVCSEEQKKCLSAAPDLDRDGHRDASCKDENGDALGDDCDDQDNNRFPGNIELCDVDGHDEDCDEETYGKVDADGDRFDDAQCCNTRADGSLNCGDDCDDLRPNVNKTATEACDGVDNNCDGQVDEGVLVTVYEDADRDGHGNPNVSAQRCAGAAGFAENSDDCDDNDPARHPSQLEICDMQDNDCDQAIDEEDNIVAWYRDMDDDGFGSPGSGVTMSCTPVPGHVLSKSDCNDENPAVNPSAAELCDGIDNDCSGAADFQIGVNDFEDDDGDGVVDLACGAPLGADCDDNNPQTGPGDSERCDGRDNDCDGQVDEGASQGVWYLDLDRDGYGSVNSGATISCMAVPGYARSGGDCDDSDPNRYPNAAELCDGDDNDCDGTTDEPPAAANSCSLSNAQASCLEGECAVKKCSPGYGDCDGQNVNGCESPLNTATHCGACGASCNFQNGAGSCSAGVCVVSVCDDGWEDCDGDGSNGCETPVDTNDNCGACGNRCRIQGAVAECINFSCEVIACQGPTGDCDGNGSNGCETTFGTVDNCGFCGDACNFQNGDGDCNNGSCQVFGCSAGFADCNKFGADGCEANLSQDQFNCGGCGFRCEGSNSAQVCSAMRCEVTSCVGGFGDCDGDTHNGCEAALAGDPYNCGSCGNQCFYENAEGQCNAGSCGLGQCFPGWADCNGVPDDGCEQDLNYDYNNCGGCGIVCGGGTYCQNGACTTFEKVQGGETFSCSLRHDGIVSCWGNDASGQVGNGLSGAPTVATKIASPAGTSGRYSHLSVGAAHACAIDEVSGDVQCWGRGDKGQLGRGTLGNAPNPTSVGYYEPATAVAVGIDHTCIAAFNGEMQQYLPTCWGSDSNGQVGDGGIINATDVQLTPMELFSGTGNVQRIVAGAQFTCVYDDYNTISCWGRNDRGQLGIGTFVDQSAPNPLMGFTGYVEDLQAGLSHVCALGSDSFGIRKIWCWGANDQGQLGDPSLADQAVPVQLPVSNPVAMSVGANHTCAQVNSGSWYCVGDNTAGQLGSGTTSNFETSMTYAQELPQGGQLSRGATANHTCTIGDSVRCVGDNTFGQIDPGNIGGSRKTAVLVPGL